MTRASLLLVGLFAAVAVAQPQPPKPLIEQIEDAWKARAERVKAAEFEFEVKAVFAGGSLRDPRGKAVPEKETATSYVARYFLNGSDIRLEKAGTGWDGKEFGPIRSVSVCSPDGKHGVRDLIGTTSVVTVKQRPDYFEALADPFGPITRHIRGSGSEPIPPRDLTGFREVQQVAVIRGISAREIESRSATGDLNTFWLDPNRDWLVVRERYTHSDGKNVICDFDYVPHPECGHVLSKWTVRILSGTRQPQRSEEYVVRRTVINSGATIDREINPPTGARVLDESRSGVGTVQPDGSYLPAPDSISDQSPKRWWLRPSFWVLAVAVVGVPLVWFFRIRARRRSGSSSTPS